MKSPNTLSVIVAAIFAIIAFFIFTTIPASPIAIAISVFVSTLIAPLIKSSAPTHRNQEQSVISADDIKTLYVGNLPYRANETAVKELFSEYGQVQSVRLMKDKHTGKRRGFGFVEMASTDISKAISALNDTEFQQRTLKVREAKERPDATSNDND